MTARKLLFLTTLPLLLLGAMCQKPPADEAVVKEEAAAGDDFTGTIADLMQRGRDVHCTFQRDDVSGHMEGNVYVARDGRMRGSFTMTMPEYGAMTAEVLRDGEYGYTWGLPIYDGGIKTKLDDEGKPLHQKDDGPSVDDAMDYRCRTWNMNAAMFEVPSDIEFLDVTAQVEDLKDAMGDVNDVKCSACDQVPTESREACLEAMGC